MTAKTMEFNADVSRLLDIVANALYSNQDVFLRELISNASDACDKLRYEAIQNPDLVKKDSKYRIVITIDPKKRELHVKDNGIGMGRKDLIENLGTIAKSGTKALMEHLKSAKESREQLNLIGQFGVGFYASFMVADNVRVISRRAGENKAYHWQSDGSSGYEIREADKDEKNNLLSDRGTTVILHIDDDHSDLLIEEKIKNIIETYSDHIDIPIYLNTQDDTKDKEENKKPVNQASALWSRPKSEITEDQYKEFYWHLNNGITMDEPVLTAHWRAEGKIEYTALLFVPAMRPWDLFDPSRKHSVRLYVRRVFITDQCEGLVYPWLRFLRGVIDSQDLPLNISREMLQHNPVVTKIRNGITKRILKDLHKLSQKDVHKFNAFWEQFGSVLKEGLYENTEHQEDLFKICRFRSSIDDGKELHNLEDYLARMKDGQENIYYISGEKLETLVNSPQLEGFKSRGVEVLFMTDPIDEFWIQAARDFKGKELKSITKGDIDLSKFETSSSDNDKKQEEKTDNSKANDKKNDTLVAKLASILKDEVGSVRISKRLTQSPVCLIAGDNEVDMRTEQILKIQQKYDPQSKRVLEINPDHSLIQHLSSLADKDENQDILHEAAFLLLDQARIIQGNPVPDPTRFARSMSKFLEKSLGSSIKSA